MTTSCRWSWCLSASNTACFFDVDGAVRFNIEGCSFTAQALRHQLHLQLVVTDFKHHFLEEDIEQFTTPQILDIFFEKVVFEIRDNKLQMELVPERLRGETATFDIEANGTVYVEKARRITAVIRRAFST